MSERPNWKEIYSGVAHSPDRDQELVCITRETARLAASALQAQIEEDYYHNMGAAFRELTDTLTHSATATSEALGCIKQSVVLALAFLGRDQGTARMAKTLPEVLAELANADAILRALALPQTAGDAR